MRDHLLIANTIFYCRQWRETVRFYRDFLQLPVTFATDWFVEFRLTVAARLSIADEQRASVKTGGGQGVTLSLEVDDIQDVWNSMENAGLKPSHFKPHAWNANVFYLFDPEGHRLEIWQRR